MEESLRRLRTRVDLIDFLDSMDRGAYIVDQNRRIVYWNRRAQELTGYTLEEVNGRPCSDNILNHVDRTGLEVCTSDLCPLYRSIRSEKSVSLPSAVYAMTKWGKRIPCSVTTFPLYMQNQLVGGVEIFEQASPDDQDMITAMNIQKTMIPRQQPPRMRAFYHPSSFLGGDLVYVREPWAAVVDVSGHGTSSALISTLLRVILGEILHPRLPIEDLGNLMEQRYQELGDVNLFFTGIFLKRMEEGVELVSFGHPAPMLVGREGARTVEIDHGVLMGWGKEHNNSVFQLPLGEEESLLLYSDGLTELDTESGPLGEEGVLSILRETRDPETIFLRSMERSTETSHRDDISLVVVHGQ